MKKKILCTALVASLVLSAAGCGETENSVAADNGAATTSADNINADEKETEEETTESSEQEEINQIDISTTDRYSDTFQFGDKIIALPSTVKELVEDGEITTKSELDKSIEAGKREEVYFRLGEESISLYAYNETSDSLELGDCIVKPQLVSANEYKEFVIFNGGIHTGMSIDELTALYGEPDRKADEYGQECYYYCEEYCIPQGSSTPTSANGYYYKVYVQDNKIMNINYNMGTRSEEPKLRKFNFIKGFAAFMYPSYFMDDVCMIESNGTNYFIQMDIDGGLYRDKHEDKKYFPEAYTEENLKALFPDALYCEVLDSARAVVVAKDTRYDWKTNAYIAYTYAGDFCRDWSVVVRYADSDCKDDIPDDVEKSAVDLLVEISKTIEYPVG